MILKVQNIIAPTHKMRKGLCKPCAHIFIWHVSNGPTVRRVACPMCGQPLENSGRVDHLPCYSLDGVSFDDGKTLKMFTPWGGYGDGS